MNFDNILACKIKCSAGVEVVCWEGYNDICITEDFPKSRAVVLGK